MSRLRKAAILTVIALLNLPLPAFAQAGASDIEFLSKHDTRAIFAMTHGQWGDYVHRAVKAGMAKAMGSATSGLAMGMKTGSGSLVIRPDYRSGEDKPLFIQVTVAYRSPKAETLTESALTGAIDAAQKELAPEYRVAGKVEKFRAGVAIVYVITEAGR